MLYNPKLNKKSYETSDEICKLINEANVLNGMLYLNESENFKNDAVLYDLREVTQLTVELKQRQNDFLRKVLDGKTKMYNEITIQKSSCEHDTDVFIIYDKTMTCALIFHKENINREVVTRNEFTEIGIRTIKYYTVNPEDCMLIDLTKKRP